MENDPVLDEVRVTPDYDGYRGYNSRPEIAYMFPRGDVGWKMAGEVVGNNTSIEVLAVRGAVEDKLKAFFNGARRNGSISGLALIACDVMRGAPLLSMVPLLENNCNLTTLKLWGIPAGNNDGIRELASALSSCTHRLETLSIRDCSIEDGAPFEQLVAALIPNQVGQNPTLGELDLSMNNIGRNGCSVLATMLRNPRCRLNRLDLSTNGIDDEGVTSLADGLTKNDKLAVLNIAKGNPITNNGWTVIAKILCNKSCINKTFLSNHSLQDLGQEGYPIVKLPIDLESHLKLNSKGKSDPLNDDQPFVPIQKILDNHHDWNMFTLIDEDIKMLTYILGWIDRAGVANRIFDGITKKKKRQNTKTLRGRRHSTIHQFVRSMPLIMVEKLMMNESG